MGGLSGKEQEEPFESIRFYPLIVLSIATSIDALAVGVSFGVLQTSILVPAVIIGIVCFGISFAGVMLGKRLETVLGDKMEVFGGIILILIGVKFFMSTYLAENAATVYLILKGRQNHNMAP